MIYVKNRFPREKPGTKKLLITYFIAFFFVRIPFRSAKRINFTLNNSKILLITSGETYLWFKEEESRTWEVQVCFGLQDKGT